MTICLLLSNGMRPEECARVILAESFTGIRTITRTIIAPLDAVKAIAPALLGAARIVASDGDFRPVDVAYG